MSAELEHQRSLLRYASFSKLVTYLETTILADLPNLNLPDYHILNLILTATTLPPQTTPDLRYLDDGSSKRPLHLRCLDLIRQLMDILRLDSRPVDAFFGPELPSAEAYDNLRALLYQLFEFLTYNDASLTRSARRRAEDMSNHSRFDPLPNKNAATLYGLSTDEDKLKDQLLTNKNFNKVHLSSWEFFRWGFKCADRQDEKPYFVSWRIWKNLLHLFLDFYWYDFGRQEYSGDSNGRLENIKSTLIYQAMFALNEHTMKAALTELIDIAFTSKDSFSAPIFVNELRLLKTAVIPGETKHEGEPSDSIPLRRSLLCLCYCVLKQLSQNQSEKLVEDFAVDVGARLILRTNADVLEFFATCNPAQDEMLLVVSISLMEQITHDDVDYAEPYSWFFSSASVDDSFLSFILTAEPDFVKHSTPNRLLVHRSRLELMNLLINFQLSLWVKNNWYNLPQQRKKDTATKILYALGVMDDNRRRSLEEVYKECKLRNAVTKAETEKYLDGSLFLTRLQDIYRIKLM
ncbi:hypothetical protein KL935_004839 [Ogataea polymorpha]|nr:hypothetical protein KL937_004953 [Ogataea polymorpha]KAG7886210.1 hypothetical protein KL936_004888 [Ogataea polymorpha]KAG7894276.1 hypothetical protein KL908_001648 [Ogataea polymorpha]KAG7897658.1 hypothetical protein KL935_004839 [Ogataea polymorpha]KAG7910216.1 hypothetical protein KL906_002121 [Ogataea polymorpha]